jgi:hypothetical protein
MPAVWRDGDYSEKRSQVEEGAVQRAIQGSEQGSATVPSDQKKGRMEHIN